jgi:hypothetical protein
VSHSLNLFHAVQVDASHVGIGAKLSDYQDNVPGGLV